MNRVPAYDNHLHMSPGGRNIDALKEFEAAGGTGLTLVTLPYPEVPVSKGEDFARSYDITYRMAQTAREETGLEVNVAVGPYPVLLIGLAERYGLPAAEDMLMRGMEDAGKAVEEGRAAAIGEIGRPHFPCSQEIWDSSNRILGRGMEIAREAGVPVIIHCESGTAETNRSLAEIARAAGLDPGMVIKHSSPPLVTPEETFGVMPSMPASKTNIKEALSKGSDRFMLETDYIDDPSKPGAVMSVTTVPNKVRWMLASGIADEDLVCRICRDIPDRYYRRRRPRSVASVIIPDRGLLSMKAKITCVYDEGALPNTHLIGAIGMSIMIDADGKRFLFGLGHRPRYLENNMGELGIEPDSVDAVVVSHNHMDHRGALDGFMRERTKPIDFYAPASCFAEERKRFGRTDGMYPPEGKEGLMYRNDVAGWTDLSEHVHISPPMTQNGADECFLVVSTKVGPVLIVGCCHMGLDHAVDAVKERFGRIPAAVIGGLHIGKKNDRLADVYAGYLKDLGIKRLYLNHCTNERGIDRMRVTLGIDGVKDFFGGQTLEFDLL